MHFPCVQVFETTHFYWVRSRFCHKLCRPASQHWCERSNVQLPCFEANLMLNPKSRSRATSFALEERWRIKSTTGLGSIMSQHQMVAWQACHGFSGQNWFHCFQL